MKQSRRVVRRLAAAGLGTVVLLAGCVRVVHERDARPAAQEQRDTALPADAGLGNASDATNEPSAEPCDLPSEVRCAGYARARQRCAGGFWAATVPCAEGEVCSSDSALAGRCVAVAAICRGSGGRVVCDADGIMYRCGDDGVAVSSEGCPTPRHCQLGIAAQSCTLCLPGEFRCQGDVLEACDADGQAFSRAQECAAGSCDAEAGLCRGEACSETRSLCQDGELQTCAEGESEYRTLESCTPGLCNAGRSACDVCLPGIDSCDGETALRCAADGSALEQVDCAADQRHCTGAGRCVTCTSDAECGARGACEQSYCDLARGICESRPRPAGTPCQEGVCTADARCVGCVADEHCPDVGECEIRHCDRARGVCSPAFAARGDACSGGQCDGDGRCTTCQTDSDCPDPGGCQIRHCDLASSACVPEPAPEGTVCSAGACDNAGRCSGCQDDASCPDVGECQRKSCDTSTKICEAKPADDGSACQAGFGAGSCLTGACVQCTTDAACSGAAGCEEDFCRTSDHTCQRRPRATGATCSGDRVCDAGQNCVACTVDAHCGDDAVCLDATCNCQPGFVENSTGTKGCNLDECANFDDNRCGASVTTGNVCINASDGYACTCANGWETGPSQCYQGGSKAPPRRVPNGGSWNVVPNFRIVCQNTDGDDCDEAQLSFVSLCAVQGAPAQCSAIAANNDNQFNAVALRRVEYDGPLEDYGNPPPLAEFTTQIAQPVVGDVILVQSLSALYIMRVTAVDLSALRYEWAMLWRDACWRPGGPTCTAACACPGGT